MGKRREGEALLRSTCHGGPKLPPRGWSQAGIEHFTPMHFFPKPSPKWNNAQPRLYGAGPKACPSLSMMRSTIMCARLVRDRESRSIRRVEAYLHRQDGREVRAFLTNVSNGGCQLRPREMPAIGETVRIEIPRLGSFAATIRWAADGYAGAEFVPQSDIWEETRNSGA